MKGQKVIRGKLKLYILEAFLLFYFSVLGTIAQVCASQIISVGFENYQKRQNQKKNNQKCPFRYSIYPADKFSKEKSYLKREGGSLDLSPSWILEKKGNHSMSIFVSTSTLLSRVCHGHPNFGL